MDADFAEIKIVSLEDQLSVESPNDRRLTYIYFKLSQTPPPLWTRHFAASRKVARHPRWRQAWIDRKYIVVECLPEEIETHHLRDLKQDLASANSRYREHLEHAQRSERERNATQSLNQDRIREMKSRLNFD
jgi:hypothetical protein